MSTEDVKTDQDLSEDIKPVGTGSWFGDIMVLENAISDELSKNVIQYIEKSKKDNAGGPLDRHYVKLSLDDPHDSPKVTQKLDDALFEIYGEALNKYINTYGLQYFGPMSDEGYTLLRYEGFDGYGPHIDGNERVLSIVLFLNDDFSGGVWDFVRQNVQIMPRKGTILVYPSNYTHPHSVSAVKDGVQYAAISWFAMTPGGAK